MIIIRYVKFYQLSILQFSYKELLFLFILLCKGILCSTKQIQSFLHLNMALLMKSLYKICIFVNCRSHSAVLFQPLWHPEIDLSPNSYFLVYCSNAACLILLFSYWLWFCVCSIFQWLEIFLNKGFQRRYVTNVSEMLFWFRKISMLYFVYDIE